MSNNNPELIANITDYPVNKRELIESETKDLLAEIIAKVERYARYKVA